MKTSNTSTSETRNLVIFFVIAFGWTWIYWSLFIFQIIKLPPGIGTPNVSLQDMLVYIPIVVFSPYGPTFAAFLLTYINEGRELAKELWRKSWDSDIPLKWLLITILWFPLVNLVFRTISAFVFDVTQPQLQWINNPLIIMMPFIASIINGGLSEEIGWRGYALPRLQSRFSAFQSSIILGFLEGLWHAPLVFWQGDQRYGMSILLLIIHQTIATFQRTWIFNNTGESILSAILFHAMGNTAGWIIPFNLPSISWLPRTKFVSLFFLICNIVIISAIVIIYGPEEMVRNKTT